MMLQRLPWPSKGFAFGSNLRFRGRQSTVTMFFTRWPREDILSPFLQYFATGSDPASCQGYEEYGFFKYLSERNSNYRLIYTP